MRAVRQGGPPAEGRPAVTLAEHLHVARRRVLLNAAGLADGYKHLVCARLSISRPHLDKWIALYGIGEAFRHNAQRTRRSLDRAGTLGG